MQIFLSVLSVIGIILLVILCIIVVLLLLILLTPVTYKAHIEKNEEFTADGEVSWLLGVFKAVFSFKDKKFDWGMRLLFLDLKKLITEKKNAPKKPKKKRKKKLKKAKKQPTIMPGEKADKQVAKDARSAAEAEIKIKTGKLPPPDNIYAEEAKPNRLIGKIKYTFYSVRDKINKGFDIYAAYKAVKKRLFKIIAHVLPKKISGYIKFGFADPSVTGKTLAVICMFYPIVPEKLSLEPHFDEAVMECDVNIKGRIFLIVLLINGLKIYFNEQVKIVMGRKKGGK